MDFLVLRLSMPFLSISQVLEMWGDSLVSSADVVFYICEKFKLTHNVNFRVIDTPYKLIETENEATWDRIYNDDTLKERILHNRFMDDNPRLKTRIYLGVKRCDKRLLKYYYDNYAIVKKNNVKTIQIGRRVSTLLYEMAPMSIDDRRMTILNHVLTIKNKENVTLCVVYADGNVELVKTDETRDLEFLLRMPESLACIYNTIHPKKRPRDRKHEYNRPTLRRRLAFK